MSLTLRSWHIGDEESLINLFNKVDRSNCDLHIPEVGTCSKSDASSYICSYVDLAFYGTGYSCAIEVSGSIVGHVQYLKDSDLHEASGYLEIFLLPEACGKGIALDALKQMIDDALYSRNLEKVFAYIFETNKAAIRLAEKAGMKFCGIDRSKEWTLNGKVCPKLVYCIGRPKKERINKGIELIPCEARDIDNILEVYNTADFSLHSPPKFFENIILGYLDHPMMRPSEEFLQGCYMRAMREMVDHWGGNEHAGYGIHRVVLYNGDIVGLVHLETQKGKNQPEGDLEFLMMPQYCGMGIATKAVSLLVSEAFSYNSSYHIFARVLATNNAALRVLQNNGFLYEGTFHDADSCDDMPTDYLVYGISRSIIANQKENK